jgi:sialate O-acetylesterase
MPENAPVFSATASYFALHLRKELGVPVGIIGSYWGGTPAVTWLDEVYLRKDEQLKIYLDEYEQGLANMDIEDNLAFSRQMRMSMNTPEALKRDDLEMRGMLEAPSFAPTSTPQDSEQAKQMQAMMRFFMQTGPTSPNRPGGLYNTMVKPIAGYSCRGFIWYQGEADYRKAELYQRLFTAVIACWRRDWNEDLPFLFVQLAPFGSWRGATGDRFPLMREAQEQVSKTVPGTWMVSIMDDGEELDVHPRSKQPAGERLALLALGKVYGQDILCEAPDFEKAEVSEGHLTLTFLNCGDGLSLAGSTVDALEVHINGEKVSDFSVVADGARLRIDSDKFTRGVQVEVRFAWAGYCKVNLYNSANLPAKPFMWTIDEKENI